jgi:hypothetical protein
VKNSSTFTLRLTNSRLFLGETYFALADERVVLHGERECPSAISCFMPSDGLNRFIEAWIANREMLSGDLARGRINAAGSRSVSRPIRYRSARTTESPKGPMRVMGSDYDYDPEVELDDPERLIERITDPSKIIERPGRILPEREIQRRISVPPNERKPESSATSQEHTYATPALDRELLAKVLISGGAEDGRRRLLLLPAVRGCVGRVAEGQAPSTTELLLDVSRPIGDLPPLRILDEVA